MAEFRDYSFSDLVGQTLKHVDTVIMPGKGKMVGTDAFQVFFEWGNGAKQRITVDGAGGEPDVRRALGAALVAEEAPVPNHGTVNVGLRFSNRLTIHMNMVGPIETDY